MGKVDVNGEGAIPLYKWLTTQKPKMFGFVNKVTWNFEKFLIGKDGEIKQRWWPTTKPEALEKTILDELAK